MITAVSIFSCTNDYDPGLIENLGMKEQPLRIITKVLTTKSPNFMQEFTRGSVIGLHVVSESTGNIYDSNPDYKNVRAEAFLVNNKLNWRQSPDIYLNEEPVTVYAYYPYQSQVNFDPKNIPVRISPDASLTKDYMYGIQASGQRAVNQISPVALLNMNHTLSLLSFQLRMTPEAEGCFLLHAIQIGNKAGGTALCFRGKMNIKNRKYRRMCRNKCLYPTETEYSAHVEKDTGRAATTNGNSHIAYQNRRRCGSALHYQRNDIQI